MGNALNTLIAQATPGEEEEEEEESILLTEEHGLLLTCCWVTLKVTLCSPLSSSRFSLAGSNVAVALGSP